MTDREDNAILPRAQILPLLIDPRVTGGYVMSFCPAHNDGEKHNGKDGRSLTLSKAGVLECQAGCKFGDVMRALRERAGVKRESPPERAGRPPAAGRDRPWSQTAVYDFRDASGKLVAQHVRLEAPDPEASKGYVKRFTWRISAEDRRTLRAAGMSEDDIPLYGLASLTSDREQWVNWPEGEKCCSAFHARNEPAVTSGGGASQKSFGKSLEAVRGRKVRIWPDNDPAGAGYANTVKLALRGIAAKVVVMPPVGGEGQDVADVLAAGATLEQLIEGALIDDRVEYLADDHIRVRLATEFGEISFDVDALEDTRRELNCELTVEHHSQLAPVPYSQRVNLLSASATEGLARILGKHFPEKVAWVSIINRAVMHIREYLRRVPILDMEELDTEARPADWILRGYLLREGGTILFGLPKRGKSQVAMALAAAVDAGLQNDVFDVKRPHRVLYINLERSGASMRARLTRINRALGLPATRKILMIHRRGTGLGPILPAVRQIIREHGVEVVFLDSISRGGFGDLNDNRTANTAIDALNGLGIAWLAIGHSPRAIPGEQQHLFGSIHQDAGADILVSLDSRHRGDNDLLATLRVTHANDTGHVPDLDLALHFGESGLESIHRAAGADVNELEELKPTNDRRELVRRFLRAAGRSERAEIAAAIGVDEKVVGRYLNPLLEAGLITKEADAPGRGSKTYYTLAGPISMHHQSPNSDAPSTDGASFTCGTCSRTLPESYFWDYDDRGAERCAGCGETKGVAGA